MSKFKRMLPVVLKILKLILNNSPYHTLGVAFLMACTLVLTAATSTRLASCILAVLW